MSVAKVKVKHFLFCFFSSFNWDTYLDPSFLLFYSSLAVSRTSCYIQNLNALSKIKIAEIKGKESVLAGVLHPFPLFIKMHAFADWCA